MQFGLANLHLSGAFEQRQPPSRPSRTESALSYHAPQPHLDKYRKPLNPPQQLRHALYSRDTATRCYLVRSGVQAQTQEGFREGDGNRR
jgi:hypothetical protein